MKNQTFEARVRIDGRIVRVQIDAITLLEARRILEAQYGKGSIQGIDAVRR